MLNLLQLFMKNNNNTNKCMLLFLKQKARRITTFMNTIPDYN